MSKTLTVAGALLLASATAMADPGYYLVTVYENEGQANIDFRYWTVKFAGSAATIWPEIGVGYGVTKRWYTEVYASYIGSAGQYLVSPSDTVTSPASPWARIAGR